MTNKSQPVLALLMGLSVAMLGYSGVQQVDFRNCKETKAFMVSQGVPLAIGVYSTIQLWKGASCCKCLAMVMRLATIAHCIGVVAYLGYMGQLQNYDMVLSYLPFLLICVTHLYLVSSKVSNSDLSQAKPSKPKKNKKFTAPSEPYVTDLSQLLQPQSQQTS